MLYLHRGDRHRSGPVRPTSGSLHTAMYHCSGKKTVEMGLHCTVLWRADQTLSHPTLSHPVHCRAANRRTIVYSSAVTSTQSSASAPLDYAVRCIRLALEK